MKMRAAVADGDGDDDGAGAPVQVSVDPAAYRDWSALPDDLLLTVMESLAIPDLFRAGTACASWYAAYSIARRARIPILRRRRRRPQHGHPVQPLERGLLPRAAPGPAAPEPRPRRLSARLARHRRRAIQPPPREPAHRRAGRAPARHGPPPCGELRGRGREHSV
ncbi:hypothetical protein EE612_056451 [Oryza sativa]|nr:hypothetical protein EE612_056451 [Oryza sativa]